MKPDDISQEDWDNRIIIKGDDHLLSFLQMAGQVCIDTNYKSWVQLVPACKMAATILTALKTGDIRLQDAIIDAYSDAFADTTISEEQYARFAEIAMEIISKWRG